jgi:hypothetical protein
LIAAALKAVDRVLPVRGFESLPLRSAGALGAGLVVLALLAGSAPAASANPQLPPKGKVFFGWTDSGQVQRFNRFARLVGKHPPVIATYDHWRPANVREAFRRWRRARVRPMLSVQTGPLGNVRITPRAIAKGKGDRYLLFLHRRFDSYGRPGYIRLLPEPNGHWNSYCPYNADGSSRGPAYKTYWHRLAWRRMVIVIRDGGTLRRINTRLRKNGLPRLGRSAGVDPPETLEPTRTAFVWTPQTFGSPDLPRNMPRWFWPGKKFVDWVGTDFYSKFPAWSDLNRFYRQFKRKPFAFGEWGVWGADDPGFVRRLLKFARTHRRVRMLVYYNGGSLDDGKGPNPFDIGKRPRSRAALSARLRRARFPAFAREWAP